MRLLLDTHAFLWWLAGDKRLSIRARRAVAEETNVVFVSAVSAWEVATKVRIGKLPGADFMAHAFGEQLALQGFLGLDITVHHGERAGSLPGPHRDPFDRMLIAQAQSENLTIVSNEMVFDRYAVTRLW